MDQIIAKIQQQISSKPIVLYMKGNAQMPQCGFSAKVVKIIQQCGVTDFLTIDVLADDAIRQGIKQYANWPTIPQLYVNGEFIGGCDIIAELYQEGVLEELLTNKVQTAQETQTAQAASKMQEAQN